MQASFNQLEDEGEILRLVCRQAGSVHGYKQTCIAAALQFHLGKVLKGYGEKILLKRVASHFV